MSKFPKIERAVIALSAIIVAVWSFRVAQSFPTNCTAPEDDSIVASSTINCADEMLKGAIITPQIRRNAIGIVPKNRDVNDVVSGTNVSLLDPIPTPTPASSETPDANTGANETPEIPISDTEITSETPVSETTISDPDTPVETKLLESVPFDATTQRCIFEEVCGGDPEKFVMLIAVGHQETSGSFNPYALGDNGNAYGWLQTHPYWHWSRMAKHGIYSAEELYDPVKAAYVGLDYLEEIKHDRLGVTAMTADVYNVYNAGHLSTNATVISRANNVMSYYNTYMAEFVANNP